MTLVLGGLPKFKDNTLYLTNRLRSKGDPCIDIRRSYIHMLFQALYYDNLISLPDIQYLERIMPDVEDRVSLIDLEALSDRHSELFLHLRGYFKPYNPGSDETNIILPIIPGLANTSLLQSLVYNRKRYVIDTRNNGININFLKSIVNTLDGEVYVVSDTIILNPLEIIVGRDVDLNILRNLSHEPYNLLKKTLNLSSGRYKVKSKAPEFLREQIHTPEYEKAEPVDILEHVFVSGERDYSNDVENILYSIWTNGSMTEVDLINSLLEVFEEDYIVRVVLYLLLRYGLISYTTTPAGRQYMITVKAMRVILERNKERRKG